MTSIIYVGMDVHTTNFTLCCYDAATDSCFACIQTEPDYRKILSYLKRVEKNIGHKCCFLCGYEAGYLGYTLYHQLMDHDVDCVILAPTTIPTKKNEPKTDRRDAKKISRCLAYHDYSPVYVPTSQDDAVKEYIRMRDDEKSTLKRIKQQILALCARHGQRFDGKSNWTLKHLAWLRKLDFENPILNETFREYLALYDQACNKVDLFDKRIEEFAQQEQYELRVKKLSCLLGISTHVALSTLVEVGDFKRFKTAPQFASYLGLVPGEKSSADSQKRLGITKAGNSHIRRLLIEAAQCYNRGGIGFKSKKLKAQQEGNPPEIIAYADRATERLKRKFQRMKYTKSWNTIVTAIARELACFIWGMMTDNIA